MSKPLRITVAVLTLSFFGFALQAANAADVGMAGRTLTIMGTNVGEDIYVYEQSGQAWFNPSTGEFQPAGTYLRVWVLDNTGKTMNYTSFLKNDVDLIWIASRGGSDYVDVITDVRAMIWGGDNIDYLHGGENDDYIDAGEGAADYVFGHGGRDTLLTGDKYAFWNSSQYTVLDGGRDRDTFHYRNADVLVLDNGQYAGWAVTPDRTNNFGRNGGIHVYSE